jgi:hypothetical protein
MIPPPSEHEQPEKLEDTVSHLLEEGRMLLPGIQALFGFQLIAVFNQVFRELSTGERLMHLGAITCAAICIALVLAPAAYHRMAEPRTISERFVRYSSLLFIVTMALLMAAICLDIHLIARLTGCSTGWSAALAAGLLALFLILWFAVPWCLCIRRRRRPILRC